MTTRPRFGARVKIARRKFAAPTVERDDREVAYALEWQTARMDDCALEWFEFKEDRDLRIAELREKHDGWVDYLRTFEQPIEEWHITLYSF